MAWYTFPTRGPAASADADLAGPRRVTGRRLEVLSAQAVCEGWGRGIDADGSLIVEDDSGAIRHILAGAVRVLDLSEDE